MYCTMNNCNIVRGLIFQRQQLYAYISEVHDLSSKLTDACGV